MLFRSGDDGDARAALMKKGEVILRERNVSVKSLFVGDFADRHDEMLGYIAPLVASGRIKYREDIRQGLATIPACFSEVLLGDNFGKMLVQVGEDPTI